VLAPAERNQGPRHPAIMLHHGTKCANMAPRRDDSLQLLTAVQIEWCCCCRILRREPRWHSAAH
jgi:hypothetical protein